MTDFDEQPNISMNIDDVEDDSDPVDSDPVEPEPEPVEDEPEPVEPEPVEPEPEPVEEENGNELNDVKPLNLRIAELDYLRICCANWIGKKTAGKVLFLKSWSEKNIVIDESINYESLLIQLEKLPELVKHWVNQTIDMKTSNYFININEYTLKKSLFKENSTTEEKVSVLENLIDLLIKCAKRKLTINDINSQIDNYY